MVSSGLWQFGMFEEKRKAQNYHVGIFLNIYMRTYALPSAKRAFSSEQECSFGEIQSLIFKLCPTLPLSCHSKNCLLKPTKIFKMSDSEIFKS